VVVERTDEDTSGSCPSCGGTDAYEWRERRHLLEPPGKPLRRCSSCHTVLGAA
jgi:hypothetical protein